MMLDFVLASSSWSSFRRLATASESSFPADLLPFFEIFAPAAPTPDGRALPADENRHRGFLDLATTRASFFAPSALCRRD